MEKETLVKSAAATISLLNPRSSQLSRAATIEAVLNAAIGDFLAAVDDGLDAAGFGLGDVNDHSFTATTGSIAIRVEFEARRIVEPRPDWDESLGYRTRRSIIDAYR